MVILHIVAVSGALIRQTGGVPVLVVDRILVDGGIGLRCTVVRRGDAVTGFTAVVAVPVVHSAVGVFICTQSKIALLCKKTKDHGGNVKKIFL